MSSDKNSLAIFQWAAGGIATIALVAALVGWLAGSGMGASQTDKALSVSRAIVLAPARAAVTVTFWIIALATMAGLCGAAVVAAWNKARLVYPDSQGVYPLTTKAQLINYNEPGAQVTACTRVPERLTDNRKITITSPDPAQLPQSAGAALPAIASLPEQLPLSRLLPERVTLDNLTLGAAIDTSGQIAPVTSSLHDLMHTLAVGASGWGKSTWLRSFLYQLAITQDDIGIVALDCYGSEFNTLRNWKKLVYPVGRNVEEAKSLLGAVSEEITRRKTLYERYPIATKLDEYNRLADNPLSPWVVVCDEGTALLNQDGIGDPLRQTVQTARQYGVYILLAGQSAKANILDTQTRDNFSSRLCFRTSPTSSRVVLDSRDACQLAKPGRGLLLLPGKPLTEIQAGYVSREEFYNALITGETLRAMPETIIQPPQDDNETEPEFQAVVTEDDLIRQLAAEGASRRKIQQSVFGYVGGSAHDKVTAVLGAV